MTIQFFGFNGSQTHQSFINDVQRELVKEYKPPSAQITVIISSDKTTVCGTGKPTSLIRIWGDCKHFQGVHAAIGRADASFKNVECVKTY